MHTLSPESFILPSSQCAELSASEEGARQHFKVAYLQSNLCCKIVTAIAAMPLHSAYTMLRISSLVVSLTQWFHLVVTTNAIYSFQDRCLSFNPESYIHNSSRHVLAYVPAGTNLTFPDNDPTCARPNQLVAASICRVGLSIPTSERSSISFELWLPEDWSHRLLVTGNGGIDGCEFNYARLEVAYFSPPYLSR